MANITLVMKVEETDTPNKMKLTTFYLNGKPCKEYRVPRKSVIEFMRSWEFKKQLGS